MTKTVVRVVKTLTRDVVVVHPDACPWEHARSVVADMANHGDIACMFPDYDCHMLDVVHDAQHIDEPLVGDVVLDSDGDVRKVSPDLGPDIENDA